jgi:hypothetical protein
MKRRIGFYSSKEENSSLISGGADSERNGKSRKSRWILGRPENLLLSSP